MVGPWFKSGTDSDRDMCFCAPLNYKKNCPEVIMFAYECKINDLFTSRKRLASKLKL